MANKFLSNINLTAGLEDNTGQTGTSGQVLTSTGNGVSWIDQGSIAAESAEVVEVPVKNTHTATILKGTPVYISGSVGSSGRLEVKPANASVEASMPALGLLKQDLAVNAEGFCVISGKLRNLITSPIDGDTTNEGDVVYVKAGGGLTTTKPVGVNNLIQNMGKVGVSSTSNNGTFVVSSILRSNDVPNLPEGRLFVGTSDNTSLTSDVVYIDDANDRVGIGTDDPDNISSTGTILSISTSGGLTTDSLAGSLTFLTNDGSFTNTYADGVTTEISSICESATGAAYGLSFSTSTITDSNRAERLRITATGSVGIGTTSPATKLHVFKENTTSRTTTTDLISLGSSHQSVGYNGFGTAIVDYRRTYQQTNPHVINRIKFIERGDSANDWGGAIQFETKALSSGTAAPVTRMSIDYSGNVGIGTTSPERKLHVNGSGGTAAIQIDKDGDRIAWLGTGSSGSTSADDTILQMLNEGVEKVRVFTEGNSWFNGGNVGIGTTSPNRPLTIQTIDSSYGSMRIYRDSATLGETSIGFFGTATQAQNESWVIGEGGWGNSGDFVIGNENGGAGGNVRFLVQRDGNVGIGTTGPDSKLEIAGNTSSPLLTLKSISGGPNDAFMRFKDAEGGSTYSMGLDSSDEKFKIAYEADGDSLTSGTKLVMDTFGNVGIGTTDPNDMLEVRGSSPNIRVTNTAETDAGIVFTDAQTLDTQMAAIKFNASDNKLKFFVNDEFAQRMVIDTVGNVGIGTTDPGTKLDVSGVITATGGNSTNWNTAYGWGNHAGLYNTIIGTDSDISYTGATVLSTMTMTDGVVQSHSSRQLSNLRIPDTRAGEITPNGYLDRSLSLDFTDEFGSLGAWYSGITLKGWSDGYTAWQLIANATNNTNDQNLYFRSGRDNSWGTMHKVFHSGNLTAGTNVSISSSGVISSTATSSKWDNVIGGINYAYGKVGVGTGTPKGRLHVGSGGGNETTVVIGAAGNDNDKSSRILLNEGEAGVTDSLDYGFSLAYDGRGDQYAGLTANEFGILRHNNNAGGTPIMIMNRTDNNVEFLGNVGIGTDTPTALIHINRALSSYAVNIGNTDVRSGLKVISSTNDDSQLTFSQGVSGSQLIQSSNQAGTAGKNIFLNPFGGNVGIGTTSAANKLQVAGTIYGNGGIIGSSNLLLQDTASAYSTELKMQNNTHTIGIDYQNNETLRFITRSAATTVPITFQMRAGTITATNFILSSDERKKSKIKDLSSDNIDVRWRSFEMKDNEGEYRTGVIAQELEENHPEFVNTNDEGFKSVKYIDLLIAKIAELENRIKELEK